MCQMQLNLYSMEDPASILWLSSIEIVVKNADKDKAVIRRAYTNASDSLMTTMMHFAFIVKASSLAIILHRNEEQGVYGLFW